MEGVRRNLLRAGLPGRKITAATIGWEKTVKSSSAADFANALADSTIVDVRRRAKYLMFPLSGNSEATLMVHLGMTGWLWLHQAGRELHPMVRHVFPLDDGRELRFEDGRKFGKMWLVNDPETVLPALSPEPLEADFTTETLAASLARRNAPIKAMLLEQSVAAGLGNLYADESLFLAGIHPDRPASGLTADEVARLRQGIVDALAAACQVYDRARDQSWPEFPDAMTAWTHPRATTEPCPNCATPMANTRVRGRGTFYCPECQT